MVALAFTLHLPLVKVFTQNMRKWIIKPRNFQVSLKMVTYVNFGVHSYPEIVI